MDMRWGSQRDYRFWQFARHNKFYWTLLIMIVAVIALVVDLKPSGPEVQDLICRTDRDLVRQDLDRQHCQTQFNQIRFSFDNIELTQRKGTQTNQKHPAGFRLKNINFPFIIIITLELPDWKQASNRRIVKSKTIQIQFGKWGLFSHKLMRRTCNIGRTLGVRLTNDHWPSEVFTTYKKAKFDLKLFRLF